MSQNAESYTCLCAAGFSGRNCERGESRPNNTLLNIALGTKLSQLASLSTRQGKNIEVFQVVFKSTYLTMLIL